MGVLSRTGGDTLPQEGVLVVIENLDNSKYYKTVTGKFNSKVETKLNSDTKVEKSAICKLNNNGNSQHAVHVKNKFFKKKTPKCEHGKLPKSNENIIGYNLSNYKEIIQDVYLFSTVSTSRVIAGQ